MNTQLAAPPFTPECPAPPIPPDPLALGAGIFLRSLRFMDPELASQLDHVAVPVDVRSRNINRDEDWYREADCARIGWSWFTTDPGEYREAIAFTASVGGVAFMINGEKELRGRRWLARRIAEAARRACDEFGVRLGLVSYSAPQTVEDFPWEAFAELCDFGMPEIYDREGKYDPRYPARAIKGYRKAGFRRVLTACGAYQRREGGKGWRWRTNAELRRHLALFPAGSAGPMETRTAWTLGGRVPRRVGRGLVGASPSQVARVVHHLRGGARGPAVGCRRNVESG